jgi:uncharacterized protein (DUF697 family)
MNQSTLVQIAERLERLAARLPEKIRRPVLRELVPLKQLFLQQRRPRFLFIGSSKTPMPQIIDMLFAPESHEGLNMTLTAVHRWTEWTIPGRGTISILDARDAGNSAEAQIQEELRRETADAAFFFDDGESNLSEHSVAVPGGTKIIGLSLGSANRLTELEQLLDTQLRVQGRLVSVIGIGDKQSAETRRLMSLLAAELPNQAKIEMIRISRDRLAQLHVAQMLTKSTTAICAAIGAQPIPLADMPVLTTLQVLMVSGIMYISGRERSLRAATEFMAALGANVGVGMLLREGTRAMLKFFPGWGNVVCGMVAGAGTYAIGRAATAYFLEGASLKEAKQTYLKSRRKRSRRALPSHE